MASEWYYLSGSKVLGPCSSEVLRRLAAKGDVCLDTRVKKGGSEKWVTAAKIKGLFPEVERDGMVKPITFVPQEELKSSATVAVVRFPFHESWRRPVPLAIMLGIAIVLFAAPIVWYSMRIDVAKPILLPAASNVAKEVNKVANRSQTLAEEPGGTLPNQNARLPDADSRKNLLSPLHSRRDEFQEVTFYDRGCLWLDSQICLYIAESRDRYTLRLKVQYYGKDWVFWDRLVIKGDDKVVRLNVDVSTVKRKNMSGSVWETLDVPVAWGVIGTGDLRFNESVVPVFAALLTAKTASMRLAGESLHDREIDEDELGKFHDVANVYFALFGVKDGVEAAR